MHGRSFSRHLVPLVGGTVGSDGVVRPMQAQVPSGAAYDMNEGARQALDSMDAEGYGGGGGGGRGRHPSAHSGPEGRRAARTSDFGTGR